MIDSESEREDLFRTLQRKRKSDLLSKLRKLLDELHMEVCSCSFPGSVCVQLFSVRARACVLRFFECLSCPCARACVCVYVFV